MDWREVLFEDLISAAKDSSVVTLDVMDVTLRRGQAKVSKEVATGLQGLEAVAKSVGRHIAFSTKGPCSELAEVIRAITGSEPLDFSNMVEMELSSGDEHYRLRQYPKVKFPGLNVFGVYANGGVFVFFDKQGVYTELDLMDPESVKPARRLTETASKSNILGGAMRKYRTPYPAGYLVITLPTNQDTKLYMDQLESALRSMIEGLEMSAYLKVSRKESFRLYVEPKKQKNGEELNKYNGLKLGASQAAVLGGLGFGIDGNIHVADNIKSESELIMLKEAKLGVEVTNDPENVLRLVKGLPPILYVRDGPEALKEVTLALSLARPEIASQVHGQLRRMGYNGRESAGIPWNIARAYVLEAVCATDTDKVQ